MSIFDFTPEGFESDAYKKRILEDIQKEINKGTKYILIEAPTGIGKSWIASTVALWMKDSCILTPEKKLQDQYKRDFSNFMQTVKGKNSFPCMQLQDANNCNFGDCRPEGQEQCEFLCSADDFQMEPESRGTKNEKIKLLKNTDVCPYWEQKFRGELSSFPVYNYDMFIATQINDPEKEIESVSRFRQVLICDESDQLEDKLSNHLSMELTIDDLELVPNSNLKLNFDKINSETPLKNVVAFVEKLVFELEDELKLQKQHSVCSSFLSSLNHIRQHPELVCEKHPKRRNKTCVGNCKKSFNFVNSLSCYKCTDHLPLDNTKSLCAGDHQRFNQISQKKIEAKIQIFKQKIAEINYKFDTYTVSKVESDSHKRKTVVVESTDISKLVQKMFKRFNHVIFISSTIDEDNFLKNLGIGKSTDHLDKEFVIPYERLRVSAKKILMDSANASEKQKIISSPELYYKFEFESEYFLRDWMTLYLKTAEYLEMNKTKLERITSLRMMSSQ